jgi:hypothetical protein
MDSKYAFTTIHFHGALYKERRLINLEGKSVKYGQEILELLEAVWVPKCVVGKNYWGRRQQLFRETKKLIGKPNEQLSQEYKLQLHKVQFH